MGWEGAAGGWRAEGRVLLLPWACTWWCHRLCRRDRSGLGWCLLLLLLLLAAGPWRREAWGLWGGGKGGAPWSSCTTRQGRVRPVALHPATGRLRPAAQPAQQPGHTQALGQAVDTGVQGVQAVAVPAPEPAGPHQCRHKHGQAGPKQQPAHQDGWVAPVGVGAWLGVEASMVSHGAKHSGHNGGRQPCQCQHSAAQYLHQHHSITEQHADAALSDRKNESAEDGDPPEGGYR
mmetsp:Transcript_13337/g.28521  ORF Transcript_13337/g.28521 Transcript_13337/m.28521 type:complete len:233 (-) Transcript_13337:267-965(-)